MVAPFGDVPKLVATSADGVAIGVFAGGQGDGVALLLVHGTGSDHTTWRVLAPLLAPARRVYAMDRRGRGASGDGAEYAAALEAGDVAAAAEAVAGVTGRPVAVLGHSLGGRLALAGAIRTGAIERVIAYEGAPSAGDAALDEQLLRALSEKLVAGDRDGVLDLFMREAAGLPDAELDAFRASPLWPVRAATAPLIVRELAAALHDPAISGEALSAVRVPVLQVTGSASPSRFGDGVRALDEHLREGHVGVIEGARHNGHHTHATALAMLVERWLAG